MCLGCNTSLKTMKNYLYLMELTAKNKEEFEPDIHPTSLNNFQRKQEKIIDELAELTFDVIGIPKNNQTLRHFYLDCIHELFLGKTVTKKHIEELLINWKEHDIMKQAE